MHIIIILIALFTYSTSLSSQTPLDSIEYYQETDIESIEDLKLLLRYIYRLQKYAPEEQTLKDLFQKTKESSIRLNHIPSIVKSIISLKRPLNDNLAAVSIIKELNWVEFKFGDQLTCDNKIYIYSNYILAYNSMYNKNQYIKERRLHYAKLVCQLQEKHWGQTSFSAISEVIQSYTTISYDSTLYYLEYYNQELEKEPGQLEFHRALLERYYKNWESELAYMESWFQKKDNPVRDDLHQLAVSHRNNGHFEIADSLFQLVRQSIPPSRIIELSILNLNVGKMYTKMRKWDKAEQYLNKAYEIFKRESNFHAEEALEALQELYTISNQYEKLINNLNQKNQLLIDRKNQIIQESGNLDIYFQFLSDLQNSIHEERRKKNTTIFIVVGFFIFVGGTFYNLKLKKDRYLNQQLDKLKLRATIYQFNSHFLFNLLAGIQHLLLEKNYTLAYDGLINLSELLREMIKSIRVGLLPLSKEIDLIQKYLSLEKIHSGKKVQIHVDDKDIDFEKWLIPTGILQPLIENVFQHAFPHPKDHEILKICFQQTQNKLQIILEDNGVGIDKVSMLNATRESFGLKLVQEQMAIYEAITNKKFEINISSKHIKSFKDHGTRISLSFPKLSKKDISRLHFGTEVKLKSNHNIAE